MEIQFEAVSTQIGQHLLVRLPQQASKALPSRVMVMAEGTLNGTPFTGPWSLTAKAATGWTSAMPSPVKVKYQ